MTGTKHDDQLGEIYPSMLNELNCTSGVSSYRAMHFSAKRGLAIAIACRPSVRLSVTLVDLYHCDHIGLYGLETSETN